jgi:hypothetical protein
MQEGRAISSDLQDSATTNFHGHSNTQMCQHTSPKRSYDAFILKSNNPLTHLATSRLATPPLCSPHYAATQQIALDKPYTCTVSILSAFPALAVELHPFSFFGY